jgi:hypothetical protein
MATTRSPAGAVAEKLYSIVRDERFAMAVGTVLAVIASIPIMSNHVLVPHYILQPYQKNIKYPLYYDNLSHEDTYLLTAGVVVPMALDCVADVFSALSTAVAPRPAFLDHEQSKDSKATRLNLLERIVFVLGVTIPVVVVLRKPEPTGGSTVMSHSPSDSTKVPLAPTNPRHTDDPWRQAKTWVPGTSLPGATASP